MKREKITGGLLISGAIAIFIPYTILTFTFEYPGILRQDASIVLSKFYEGGNGLIWTWFAFAITGIPLIPAYMLIGEKVAIKAPFTRGATTIGLTGLFVQLIALLRWTFVVPVLANTFVNTRDEATSAAAILSFKTIHQFAGVLLGEHLGQLCTVAWTVLISISFAKLKLVPKWVVWLGLGSSIIYLSAQAELFATVMPNFVVWELAGFIGSTLWLIWLVVIGILFVKTKE